MKKSIRFRAQLLALEAKVSAGDKQAISELARLLPAEDGLRRRRGRQFILGVAHALKAARIYDEVQPEVRLAKFHFRKGLKDNGEVLESDLVAYARGHPEVLVAFKALGVPYKVKTVTEDLLLYSPQSFVLDHIGQLFNRNEATAKKLALRGTRLRKLLSVHARKLPAPK